MSIKTEKELADAINNGEETIKGDLINKVIIIKATGKTAWIVAIGAIGVTVVLIISTGGVGAPASAVIAAGAVAILGTSATASAVAIAVAAGGVGILNELRSYNILENDGDILVLKKG